MEIGVMGIPPLSCLPHQGREGAPYHLQDEKKVGSRIISAEQIFKELKKIQCSGDHKNWCCFHHCSQ